MRIPCLARIELLACVMALSGCASTPKEKSEAKAKPIHERGWVGGYYQKVKPGRSAADLLLGDDDTIYAYPAALKLSQSAAILTTGLATNTPAYRAGLRAGDLILELGHQKVTDLPDFWRIVTQTPPGAALAVKAYRAGQTKDYTIVAGREKYYEEGTFMIGFPGYIESFHLIPTRTAPRFSLVALGYEVNDDPPANLDSTVQRYYYECNPKYARQAHNDDWSCWLAIFRVTKGKNIVAQETVAQKAAIAESGRATVSAEFNKSDPN